MTIPQAERDVIDRVASAHGVDPLFLVAIRYAESGGAGREMGVLTVQAQSFDQQVMVAAKTLRNRLVEYAENPLLMAKTGAPDALRRVVYGQQFIAWFAQRWAPIGAENDPHNLNANWFQNVVDEYTRLVATINAPGPTLA